MLVDPIELGKGSPIAMDADSPSAVSVLEVPELGPTVPTIGLRPCKCPLGCWEQYRWWLLASAVIAAIQLLILIGCAIREAVAFIHNWRHDAIRTRDNPLMHKKIWCKFIAKELLRSYVDHNDKAAEQALVARQRPMWTWRKVVRALTFTLFSTKK